MVRPLVSPSAPVPPVARADCFEKGRADCFEEGRADVSLGGRPGKRPREAGDAPPPAAAAAAGLGERYLLDAPTAAPASGGGHGGGGWDLLGATPFPPPLPTKIGRAHV